MNITVKLNSKDLNKAVKQLERYSKRFEKKVNEFLHALADRGIEVAQMNEGDFSGYIVYSKRRKDNTIKVFAKDGMKIISEWYINSKSPEVRSVEISPLLMAEFGSGFEAIPRGVKGVGQGTLNTYGHANDPDGWYWYQDEPTSYSGDYFIKEKNGRYKFYSKGTRPSQPMLKMVEALIEEVEEIARQVFGSD